MPQDVIQPPINNILTPNEGLNVMEVESKSILPNAALTQLAEECNKPCIN